MIEHLEGFTGNVEQFIAAERGDTLTYTQRPRNGRHGTARNVVLCDAPRAGAFAEGWPAGPTRPTRRRVIRT